MNGTRRGGFPTPRAQFINNGFRLGEFLGKRGLGGSWWKALPSSLELGNTQGWRGEFGKATRVCFWKGVRKLANQRASQEVLQEL